MCERKGFFIFLEKAGKLPDKSHQASGLTGEVLLAEEASEKGGEVRRRGAVGQGKTLLFSTGGWEARERGVMPWWVP